MGIFLTWNEPVSPHPITQYRLYKNIYPTVPNRMTDLVAIVNGSTLEYDDLVYTRAVLEGNGYYYSIEAFSNSRHSIYSNLVHVTYDYGDFNTIRIARYDVSEVSLLGEESSISIFTTIELAKSSTVTFSFGEISDIDISSTSAWFLSDTLIQSGHQPQYVTNFKGWEGTGPYFGALTWLQGVPGARIYTISNDTIPWTDGYTTTEYYSPPGFLEYISSIDTYLFSIEALFDDTVDVYYSTDGTTFGSENVASPLKLRSSAAEPFVPGTMYAGSATTGGPEIWYRDTVPIWSSVHTFAADRLEVTCLKKFGSYLYAGVSAVASTDPAEVWRFADDSAGWVLVASFTDKSVITSLEVYDGDLYTMVYSLDDSTGTLREVWSTIGGDGTNWALSYSIPTVDAYITTQLATDGTLLFAGTGSDNDADPQALVYTFDGAIWTESVNFNTQFTDSASTEGRATVTALGYDATFNRIYAALGNSLEFQSNSVTIYTYPIPNLT